MTRGYLDALWNIHGYLCGCWNEICCTEGCSLDTDGSRPCGNRMGMMPRRLYSRDRWWTDMVGMMMTDRNTWCRHVSRTLTGGAFYKIGQFGNIVIETSRKFEQRVMEKQYIYTHTKCWVIIITCAHILNYNLNVWYMVITVITDPSMADIWIEFWTYCMGFSVQWYKRTWFSWNYLPCCFLLYS